MYKTVLTIADVAYLVCLLAITAGIAGALQNLGFGTSWLLGVATIAGAATGLVGGVAFVRSQMSDEPVALTLDPIAPSR